MRYTSLIWAGIWRKKTRTIFTFLAILLAFVLFGMLQGVNRAFNAGVEAANVDRLYVLSRISLIEQLPYSHLANIETVPGVEAVAHGAWFGPYYQDPKNFLFSYAVDPALYMDMYPEFRLPQDQLSAFVNTRTGAVVGKMLAAKYGWEVGDRVPLVSTIWTKPGGSSNWEFDIVGIFDHDPNNSQANLFLINYDYFEEAREFAKGTTGWFIARVDDPARGAEIGEAIDALFMNSSDETQTQNEKEYAQSFVKQLGDINFIVNAIVTAVFFTLLFLIGNTMMQAVRERIPEFAVLKALGFSDGSVIALILAESLVLCAVAAAAGLGVATLLFPAISAVIGVASLPVFVIVTGLGLAAVLALVTGLPPALHVQRLSVVDALTRR